MKSKATKKLVTAVFATTIFLMGTIESSAQEIQVQTLKVLNDGYSISAEKNIDAKLYDTKKYEEVVLICPEDEWAKVMTVDGSVTGYMPISAFKTSKELNKLTTQEKGEYIVDIAKSLIGSPYVYGGNTPNGFDCSGFTTYVYKQAGISIPRTSREQATVGTAITYEQAQPGDLVTYNGHVAIYLGDNMMIHSPSPGTKVRIDTVQFSGKVTGMRRLV